MSVPSKTAQYGRKSFRQVEAGDAAHRGKVVTGLDDRLGPGAGEHAGALLDMAREHGRKTMDEMFRAVREDASRDQKLMEPRFTRDGLAARAGSTLVRIRSMAEAGGGRAAVEALGFQGNTPRDANGVYEQGLHLLDMVEKDGVPASVTEAGVDLTVLLGQLRADIGPLGEALKAVDADTREAQISQDAKEAAMADFDDAFEGYAGLTTVLMGLAGLHEAADELRPSRRRRGRTEQVADEEDAAGDAPADDTEEDVG